MHHFSHENRTVRLDQGPDYCPICHHAVEPPVVGQVAIGRLVDNDFQTEILYRCPRALCGHAFIGRCTPDWPAVPANQTREHQKKSQNPVHLKLNSLAPIEVREPELPSEVVEVSPSFKAVYVQSSAAEAYGLNEIAGMGYRKALEFLIKDFSAKKNGDKAEKIKAMPLAACIREFVDDANIKACSNRAAWLGNDETHYVRRWEGKDISDLKILVQLTIGWVRNHVLTEKYLAEMPAQ
jgi:hypothetical protein